MIRVYFSVNATPKPSKRPRAVGIGKSFRIYSPVDKGWRSAVASAANRAAREAGVGQLDEPLDVRLVFRIKRPKSVRRPYPSVKPDVDNWAKPVLDAISHSQIWRDDSLVVDMAVRLRYSDTPGVDVTIASV